MAQGAQQQLRKRSLDPDSGAIDGERWLISIGYTDKSNKNVMVGLAAIELECGYKVYVCDCGLHGLELWLQQWCHKTISGVVAASEKISKLVKHALPEDVDVFHMSPGQFDCARGRDRLEKASMSQEDLSDADFHYNGSVNALFDFMELSYGLSPHNKSIQVHQMHVKGLMDPISVHCQESLNIFNAIPSGTEEEKGAQSLFHMMNRTHTKGGARLLRSNLCQPPMDVSIIRGRQEAVNEMVEDEQGFMQILTALQNVPDDAERVFKNICLHMDHKKQLGRGSGARPGPDLANKVTRLTLGFLGLKTFSESLQVLRNAVDSFRSEVFRKFKDTMDQAGGGELLELFGSLFSENLTTQKAAFMSRSQQIFALKSGHPLLDVYRKTFCDATQGVHDLANVCKVQNPRDFANLSVRYAEQRGFFFHVPIPRGKPNVFLENDQGDTRNALPQGFVVLVDQGKAVQCTCDELNALNMRIATAAKDCIAITESILDEKCGYIVENFLSQLVSMYDAISEIDMLAGFALLATQKQGYSRPVVTTYGPFVIQEGRHPMMEEKIEEYQSNDTWMCEDSTVQVITGPNLAGKSTFLKQNGLLVLMAQCGSFVPASFMCLTPFKNIFMLKDGVHLGNTGVSSSTQQTMKQIAHAIQHASRQSLILADEICNTSSSLYDTALCWAIAEEFLILQCKTLIATHATQLCSLSQLYPQCRCFTLSARKTPQNNDNRIEYTRKLRRGRPHESERYGIALAQKLGFPSDVIETARKMASILEQQISRKVLVESLPGLHQETLAFGISSQVACIKEMFSSGDFTPEDVFESLSKIRTSSSS